MKTTATHVKAAAINVKDFVRSSIQVMQVQSHFVCTVDKAYDFDDTDDEEVLLKNCDEINVLTALIEDSYRHERSLKALDKNKKNALKKRNNIQHQKYYIIKIILMCSKL